MAKATAATFTGIASTVRAYDSLARDVWKQQARAKATATAAAAAAAAAAAVTTKARMMMTRVIINNICRWPLKHSSKQQQGSDIPARTGVVLMMVHAAAVFEHTGQDRCGVDDGDGDTGGDPRVHLPKV